MKFQKGINLVRVPGTVLFLQYTQVIVRVALPGTQTVHKSVCVPVLCICVREMKNRPLGTALSSKALTVYSV